MSKPEPAEGPEVVTCSSDYAAKHLGALLDAAGGGAVIRVLDLSKGAVRGYITAGKPAVMDGWPDDMPLIQARTRRRYRQVRARREAELPDRLAALAAQAGRRRNAGKQRAHRARGKAAS